MNGRELNDMDPLQKAIKFHEISRKMQFAVGVLDILEMQMRRGLLTPEEYTKDRLSFLQRFRELEEELEELVSQSGA